MRPYPEYKDSGVDWLGKIPADWKLKRIKYISEVNRAALSENTDPDYEFYYIDIGNVTLGQISENIEKIKFKDAPSRARRITQYGDTLVSTVRTYLKAITPVYLEEGHLIASTGFAVLTPKSVDKRFFSYLMMSETIVDTIVSLSVGVSYPAVNSSDVAKIPVWYPADLSEQKAIADYLDHKTAVLDTIIAQKQRLIELLQEERTAVISTAVTQGLNPNAPRKPSGIEWLDDIPAHWEVKRLKWIVDEKLKYGANETTDLTDPSLPRYIRITDFDESGSLRSETFKSMEWEIASDYLLQDGDILFARSGATVGKTFQFKKYEGQACFAGYLIKAEPNTEDVTSDFLYYFTKSNAYENWRNSIFIQATIQNIGADKYQNLEVSLPPLEEQNRIVVFIQDKIDQIDATIAQTEKQIALLQEYRTTLISHAVTGKIDVRPF